MHSLFLDNLIFGSAIGFLFALLWEVLTCRIFKINHWVKKKGYHFHHSLMGPGAWLLLPLLFNLGGLISFGVGAGVILQHARNEGFVFISKIKGDTNIRMHTDNTDNTNY
jgi:hypothetical protein